MVLKKKSTNNCSLFLFWWKKVFFLVEPMQHEPTLYYYSSMKHQRHYNQSNPLAALLDPIYPEPKPDPPFQPGVSSASLVHCPLRPASDLLPRLPAENFWWSYFPSTELIVLKKLLPQVMWLLLQVLQSYYYSCYYLTPLPSPPAALESPTPNSVISIWIGFLHPWMSTVEFSCWTLTTYCKNSEESWVDDDAMRKEVDRGGGVVDSVSGKCFWSLW